MEVPPPLATSRVSDLVARCLELLESSGPDAVETLLASHRDEAALVRARLRQLSGLGLLAPDGSPTAGAIPERLGPFRLLEKLGAGGMGVVYLARDETLGREVALKLVRPELLLFESARERFRREVEVIARLRHPSILPVYSAGEEGGIPYFAMEYVDGCSLADALARLSRKRPAELSGELLSSVLHERARANPKSSAPAADLFGATWIEACLRIALSVAQALEHAHSQGIVHRDVKPSNVMLARDGRVLLLDLGLAADAEASRITRHGAEVGSLPYMPPEQLRGEQAGERGDVYSLGTLLYELLTLRCPYLAANAEATRRRILEGQPAPPASLNPAVPWDAETVCLTAMERDPERRYASAAALAADLGRVLARRPIEARRPGPALRLRRWVERNPVASTAALLGGVLLAATGTFAALQVSTNRDLRQANQDKDTALEEVRAANADLGIALARRDQISSILMEMIGSPDPWRTFPNNPVPRDTKIVDVLDHASEKILANRDLDPVVAAEISSLLGQTFTNLGLFEQAEPLLLSAFELSRAAHGASSPEHVIAAWRLGSLRYDQDRVEEATGILEQALADSESCDSCLAVRLEVLNDLGLAHQVQGNFERAEELYRRHLSMTSGNDEADIDEALQLALACNNLGTLLMEQGKLDEALAMVQRALALRRRHLPAGHARILASLNSLGVILNRQQRFAEAVPAFEEVLRHSAEQLGATNERTLATRVSLCTSLLGLGDSERVEDEARALIAARGADAEQGDRIAVTARLVLARVLLEEGRPGEVEPVLAELESLVLPDDASMAQQIEFIRQSVAAQEESAPSAEE